MKLKVRNKARLALCIVLLACLISMCGTALIQSNWGSVKVTTYTGTLNDLATMITNNTASNGKKVDIQFTKDKNSTFCFIMFQPSNATKSTPAPCILCAHGNFNSKELQMNHFIELARRGFVVISIDMASHGRSDAAINTLTQSSQGMVAAAEYAMSLDFVDNSRIGLTGHSGGQSACYTTITVENKEGAKNHISAWFISSGTMPANTMKQENITNLILGISAGKYDEVDAAMFGTDKFLSSNLAKKVVKWYYPGFSADALVEGHFYTTKGDIGIPAEGTALGVKQAYAVWNPPISHPMGHFSTVEAATAVKFFYAAFGTPTGASLIPSTNQVWQFGVFFETLGLIAFFGLVFPLVSVLLETPVFASLKRTVRGRDELPSIKSWKEWVPLSITLLALILFAYFTYFPYYGQGSKMFDSATYSSSITNSLGWWTFCCGLFALAMIVVNYGLRKLCHIKDKKKLGNPFAPAGADSVSHFLKSLLLVFTVIVLIYVPVFIAYHVFQVDFRICSFTAGLPAYKWLPDMIFRYLPLWIMFYVPNAILNANTRFKELPEWASTTICAVANGIAIVILVYLQYSTLFSTGKLWNSSSMPGILGFAVAPPLFYAAFSARYIYKRTGSAWIGGLINATIMCFITATLTSRSVSVMFHF